MTLDSIFLLFLQQKDREAEKALAIFISQNSQSKMLIHRYLTEQLANTIEISTLETIDIFAHFSGGQITSKENSSAVDDFQLLVIGLEDLETYNRCGRRRLKQVLSPDKLSFYNTQSGKRQDLSFNELAELLEISL